MNGIRSAMVLDIETAPAPALLDACGVSARAAGGRTWLHRLTAFAVFHFCESPEGMVSGLTLESAAIAPDGQSGDFPSEAEALARIETALAPLAEGGTLITYNGKRHDVPFLLMRRRSHGLFGHSLLAGLTRRDSPDHIDVMEALASDGLRWPSLTEACAVMAIPHDAHTCFASSPILPTIRKCETDVLATFLLYLAMRAAEKGTSRPFLVGWARLAEWCLETPRLEHRVQFAASEEARAALRAKPARL